MYSIAILCRHLPKQGADSTEHGSFQQLDAQQQQVQSHASMDRDWMLEPC